MSLQVPCTVIVVSYDRPKSLRRTLLSLRYQTHSDFDLTIVANKSSLSGIQDEPLSKPANLVEFNSPNISQARNVGLEHATGQVVGFCDDDAIPDPTWLSELSNPFLNDAVVAAGGYVRGRNGISFQWRARSVDRCGFDQPIKMHSQDARLLKDDSGRAIKTEGTNCAFRTQWIVENGGFDERFRYFLDETDVNRRAFASGGITAIVPTAQVQHGFAQSAIRTLDRLPKSLFEIGASQAVFLGKHAPEAEQKSAWTEFRTAQETRLKKLNAKNRLSQQGVSRLLETLDAGAKDGHNRKPISRKITPKGMSRTVFPSVGCSNGVALAGLLTKKRALTAEAKNLSAEGVQTTVFALSLTTLFQREAFTDDGFWIRTGGLFGRADRTQPLVQLKTLTARVKRECALFQKQKPMKKLIVFGWLGRKLTIGMENSQLRE
jgi:GT2 family glycosyltransferase